MSRRPSAWAIVGTTRPGSRIGASATKQTPSANVGRDLAATCEGEAGLADAAGAGQGDERDVVAAQQVANRLDVVLAADERAAGQREWSYGQGFAPGAG